MADETTARGRGDENIDHDAKPKFAKVGRFTLIDVVGMGGMGVVYEARDEQLSRRVAVKLLKGSANPDSVARMLREAKAMARLSHPNVVPVFEVGPDGDGLYVAMEYVDGLVLNAWLRQEARDTHTIITRFIEAGRGLEAAHAAGIVHRDFKPANVMIGSDGRSRVLDFGIARVPQPEKSDVPKHSSEPLRSAGSEGTLELGPVTEVGTIIGTPTYMAPEQRYGDTVDERADQYAFCVALWQALFGVVPRPNPTRAPSRKGVNRQLERALRKGLNADRDARWPSMSDLLRELENAGKPTRLVRGLRATLPVLGVTVVVFAAAGGAKWRASAAADDCRQEVQRRARLAWSDETRTTLVEGFDNVEVSFSASSADQLTIQLDEYIERWIDAAEQTCPQAGADAPSLEATLMQPASVCLDDALVSANATVSELLDPDAIIIAGSVGLVQRLADPRLCLEPEFLEATPFDPQASSPEHVRIALASLEASVAVGHGGEHLERARALVAELEQRGLDRLLPRAQLTLGRVLEEIADFDEATNLLRDAYFEGLRMGDYGTAASAASRLVSLVGKRQERHQEGLLWSLHAQFAIDRMWGSARDAQLADLQVRAGRVHAAAGDYDQANEALKSALQIRRTLMGETHPDVGATLEYMADVAIHSGEAEEASKLAFRGLAITEAAFGPQHPKVAGALETQGAVFRLRAKYDEALAVDLRALKILQEAYGEHHPDVGGMLTNVGNSHVALGQNDEAIASFRRALEAGTAADGQLDHRAATALVGLAAALSATADYQGALENTERALVVLERRLGARHDKVVLIQNNRASLLSALGRHEDALELYNDILPILRTRHGDNSEAVATNRLNTGGVYLRLQRGDEARRAFSEALAAFKRALGPTHPRVGLSMFNLAVQDLADEDEDGARVRLRAAATLLRAIPGLQPSEARGALVYLEIARPGEERKFAIEELLRVQALIEDADRSHPLADDVDAALTPLTKR